MGLAEAALVARPAIGGWPVPAPSAIGRVPAATARPSRPATRDDHLAVYLAFNQRRALHVAATRYFDASDGDAARWGRSDEWPGPAEDVADVVVTASAPWSPLSSYQQSLIGELTAGRLIDARI